MKIIFSGGGTMGSVSPLIAVIEQLLSKHQVQPNDIVWVGTYSGPEEKVMAKYDIKYEAILSGKLRRYFSIQNLIDPFKILVGFIQSFNIMTKYHPDIIVSAGGFVSVPLAYAARLYGCKVLILQLDLRPGLANIIMSKVADTVAVSWRDLLNKFGKKHTIWTGTPIRRQITNPICGLLDPRIKIYQDRPLILVMGGGTGALAINQLISSILPQLVVRYQIIHLTGPDKMIGVDLPDQNRQYYHAFEYVNEELGYLMNQSKVIISRAGIGTLTEIFAINKPAIIIPIPNSHQEVNAEYFANKGAIKIVEQDSVADGKLLAAIDSILNEEQINTNLVHRVEDLVKVDATVAFVAEIYKLLENEIK
ncbi:MAG: UDP-N-acetylglucosamine--N-acetylmuramyl-(pentapeptide) pyrophosphoryl-undecaprenol N-acetylglucosamine transferase [Candidatus Komeilibacteria bacterium]